jgi:EAL domain-containing protein (putative c-di-GMP-specific phosphodiesterase class I)
VAEDSGLIGQLTRWVIRRACQKLRGWQEQFPQLSYLYVNVNISGFDLCDPKFADYVRDTLHELKLPPGALTLEISENTLMQQLDLGSATLVRLHELGVGLSVDDFGTGYSSLSYLSALPVNSLKIDRSFVARLDGRAHDAEIVRAVVQLGDAMGRRVIAEGIETPAQVARLREIGCEFGQGYFFARPQSAEQTVVLLESLVAANAEGQPFATAGWATG